MTLDTYGMPEEQFLELFQERAQFHLRAMRMLIVASLEEKVDITGWPHDVIWKMFEAIAYDASDEARVMQKKVDPETVKERSYDPVFYPSNNEILDELKRIKALIDPKDS